MRRFSALLMVMALTCVGCTSDPDGADGTGERGEGLTLASLELDWPRADGTFVPPRRPETPKGFDDALLDRMAKILTTWSLLATVDEAVWRSGDPLSDVRTALPDEAAATLEEQLRGEVSPHLGVANVFADEVTVVGDPQVTSAWRVSTDEDRAGETFVRLELQTRTAYEVRLGDGPARVIGVLRVQGLSAYPDTTDDFGVSGGWQEFGAGDCALALDDVLRPDSEVDAAQRDLETFVEVGNSPRLTMPALGVEEKVDDAYLKRCRQGAV